MGNLNQNINYDEFKLNLISDILQLDCKSWQGNYILHKSNNDMVLSYYKALAFDDMLPGDVKRNAAQQFNDLQLGFKDQFFVTFKDFNDIINDHYEYRYCKFYLLDDEGKLNFGLSFSKKNTIDIDLNNDKLFRLENEIFIPDNFLIKKNEFTKQDGFRDQIKIKIPSKKVTEMIQFELPIIRDYNERVSHSFIIQKLKFTMLKFPADYEDKYGNTYKSDRISFSVKPYLPEVNDNLINDFDAGDLKP